MRAGCQLSVPDARLCAPNPPDRSFNCPHADARPLPAIVRPSLTIPTTPRARTSRPPAWPVRRACARRREVLSRSLHIVYLESSHARLHREKGARPASSTSLRTLHGGSHSNRCRSMNLYVYPTDHAWFEFLSRRPEIDEVNFWQPGGASVFTRLRPGELFL